MKKQVQIIMVILTLISTTSIFSSCKKEDEMEPPTISFKTDVGYTFADASVTAGSAILIGINAAKSDGEGEDKDVLNHFNISRSLNGAANTSVYDADLTSAEEENYSYDFSTTASASAGDTEKYTFTITNRDGLQGQVSLTITAQ